MSEQLSLFTLRLHKPLSILLLLACLNVDGVAVAETPETAEEEEPLPPHWIDGFKGGVENTVDNTARWFDRFFGDNRRFEEGYDSQGRLTIEPQWSAYDGWEVKSSFRAEFRLPQAEERFSAIIGRGTFDDVVSDEPTQFRSSVIDSAEDEEWILGLGFTQRGKAKPNRFYFSAGYSRWSSKSRPFMHRYAIYGSAG